MYMYITVSLGRGSLIKIPHTHTVHFRCDKLLGLLDYWQRYEKEVKDLLGWIMDEANSFSKDVTTQGDKGIEDHIESCKVNMGILLKSMYLHTLRGSVKNSYSLYGSLH